MRMTMGAVSAPRVRFLMRDTWLTIWLNAGKAKPENWISTTGRSPTTAMPTAAPDDPGLGDRRVEAPFLAELLLQTRGGAEHPAFQADVLAEHHDGPVRRHLGAQGVGDGLQEREHLHAFLRSSCAVHDRGQSRG